MGKLEQFYITFDNFMATYHAGQTVSGRVTVQLNEAMEMRGLFIVFEGKASVHWTESERYTSQGKSHTRTIHRSARETYFDIKQHLWGAGVRAPLSAGRYEFPFSMALPPYLPTSIEGEYGHVRYHCHSYIDRPWKFDPKCKLPFTVLSVVDLNLMPNAANPLTRENFKHLGCCCCESGPITATVSLNKTGFVPGENIFINATIDNKTNSDMDGSYAVLEQRVVFMAEGRTRSATHKMGRIDRGRIPAGGHFMWVNVPLKVPSLPPSGGCQIIKIDYHLVFTVDPPGLSFDLDVELPTIIGTIPLRADFSRFGLVGQTQYGLNADNLISPSPYVPSGFVPSIPAAPYGAQQPSAPPLPEFASRDMYPDMPPPTYEECVSGKVNIKDDTDNEYTTGQLDYAPRYTYYHQI